MHELKVGDKLILENTFYSKNSYSWVTVTKIGRKYFYFNGNSDPFNLKTWKNKEKSYYNLYSSKKELIEKYQQIEAIDMLRQLFNGYKPIEFSVDQMIEAIKALGVEDTFKQKMEKKFEHLDQDF